MAMPVTRHFCVILSLVTLAACVTVYFVIFGSVAHLKMSPRKKTGDIMMINADSASRSHSKKVTNQRVIDRRQAKVKQYNVLIFGESRTMSQNIGFLEKDSSSGQWQYNGMCYNHKTKLRIVMGSHVKDFIDQDVTILNMDEKSLRNNLEMLQTMTIDPVQAWIFYGREPLIRMRWWTPGLGILPLHGVWSHYNNSEVLMKYGYTVPGKPMMRTNVSIDYWSQGKTKLVSWMARNCWETFWPRSAFVKELQKHIPVDVYGACGTLECLPRLSEECQKRLQAYKFYLALESAECDDYTTEKFWETALMNNVVPVVHGAQRACYSREAPPGSYIYVGDFPSIKALADYLILLNNEPDLYAKYFQWQYQVSIGEPKQIRSPLHFELFCSIIPFIDKVKEQKLLKRPLSSFQYFSSCRNLKGKDGTFRPYMKSRLAQWHPERW
ncbi:galactoside 3(4)-L-fucosyltransferase-like [Asterias rubens]|uniref:galactoside 3(4)-L-fucosyltransferase-like n=1 Tax=Asterias rubens TaxID=7604 RepID=UPI001455CD42|nr:galactoside 3(4)-L-fucosyltransferase-like [Asterias rubens]XP_033627022.1 galactoside 3(4)-L-fucosyltransferase-like [Asterias rubens]XP_033627023.1 galactoside 3(4)-L-fucosyltransferase-like [Asterias rubens]XP_033627024.1 galactoside 3(4)-L-fucosyltransferase-like [Asterias rubens]XP_033627025.1 galactoside 3(4)-L-fucosyltransferase-like [Asterias rubens]